MLIIVFRLFGGAGVYVLGAYKLPAISKSILGSPLRCRRCGTTSLHEAFGSIGLESVHWALDAGKERGHPQLPETAPGTYPLVASLVFRIELFVCLNMFFIFVLGRSMALFWSPSS